MNVTNRALDVGILAAEVYFPASFVNQEDLEQHDAVPAGKYTIGLGQQALSFCGDREDAVSMAMTALRQLMDRHGVAAADIGRLEVGTESSVDSAKSIKSHLMAVLAVDDPGATDVEGCDCLHACYGGTAAVQNAANWVESAAWDGRYAVVVASDAACYAPGGARPTSGAGAVALLIGPDAPLALERGLSATHFADAADFFRPAGAGIYPQVDGPASLRSYLDALDVTYGRYSAKFAARAGRLFALPDADFVLFHAPYNKLVQKAFARLAYLDMCRMARPAVRPAVAVQLNRTARALHADACDSSTRSGGSDACSSGGSGLGDGAVAAMERADVHRLPPTVVPLGEGDHPLPPGSMPSELEKALRATCFAQYDLKVRPSTCIQRLCGNMYAASLWSGVAQVIETTGAGLEGRRLLLFSYGSGAAATLLSVVGRRVQGRFNLGWLQSMSDLAMRLVSRTPCSPEQFERAMLAAERRYGAAPYRPEQPVEELPPGAYYLVEVDDHYRRWYARKPAAEFPAH